LGTGSDDGKCYQEHAVPGFGKHVISGCAASSQGHQGWYSCSKAFNGQWNSGWRTHNRAIGQWIRLDFAEAVSISHMKYAQNSFADSMAKDVELEFSDDQTTTLTLRNNGYLNTFDLGATFVTTSVKITVLTSLMGNSFIGAKEIEFWGPTLCSEGWVRSNSYNFYESITPLDNITADAIEDAYSVASVTVEAAVNALTSNLSTVFTVFTVFNEAEVALEGATTELTAVTTAVTTELAAAQVGNANVAPMFIDVDGDGDQDMFVGTGGGEIWYYENTGTVNQPAYTRLIVDTTALFYGIRAGQDVTLTSGDVDGDGDVDILIGNHNGELLYYENTGNATNPTYTGMNASQSASRSTLAFVDVDDDNAIDVYVGGSDGKIRYYKHNDGTSPLFQHRFVLQEGPDNPFDGIDVGSNAVPRAIDVDDDGDIDIVIGNANGQNWYYENMGWEVKDGELVQPLRPLYRWRTGTDNPFNTFSTASNAAPAFVDTDGDGDMDVYVGSGNGDIQHYTHNSLYTTDPGWTSYTIDTRVETLALHDVSLSSLSTELTLIENDLYRHINIAKQIVELYDGFECILSEPPPGGVARLTPGEPHSVPNSGVLECANRCAAARRANSNLYHSYAMIYNHESHKCKCAKPGCDTNTLDPNNFQGENGAVVATFVIDPVVNINMTFRAVKVHSERDDTNSEPRLRVDYRFDATMLDTASVTTTDNRHFELSSTTIDDIYDRVGMSVLNSSASPMTGQGSIYMDWLGSEHFKDTDIYPLSTSEVVHANHVLHRTSSDTSHMDDIDTKKYAVDIGFLNTRSRDTYTSSNVEYSEKCVSCVHGFGLDENDVCSLCPANKISNVAQTHCESCPAGKGSIYGELCKTCAFGKTSNGDGTGCYPICPKSMYARLDDGDFHCTECAAGKYTSTSGKRSCDQCLPGYYAPVSGATECQACGSKTYNDEFGKRRCKDCPTGLGLNGQALQSRKECRGCPDNFYLDEITCEICPMGYFSNNGDTACQTCPLGTYSEMGQDCTDCPQGTYGIAGGQCTPCIPGTTTDMPGSKSLASCKLMQSGEGSYYNSLNCEQRNLLYKTKCSDTCSTSPDINCKLLYNFTGVCNRREHVEVRNMTFDDALYPVCDGEDALLIWNGHRNVIEISEPGNCTAIRTIHAAYENLGHYKLFKENEVTASPGQTRYFACQTRCGTGKRFSTFSTYCLAATGTSSSDTTATGTSSSDTTATGTSSSDTTATNYRL